MTGLFGKILILLCFMVTIAESISYKSYYTKKLRKVDRLKSIKSIQFNRPLGKSLEIPKKSAWNKGKEVVCLRDKGCNFKQTCNMYSKRCERCKIRMEICRRDANCCNKDLQCVYGRCREPLKRQGGKGHMCDTDKDCNPRMCCAKNNGVSVCKPQLEYYQLCSLSPGGINHSIDHHCPCAEGLHCRADFFGLYTRCLRIR